MKIAEIKEMGVEEIAALIREKEAELLSLRLKHNSTQGAENPSRITVLRKTIAQLKTVANQKKVNQ
ncbi:MAG: 50S ribosomal protein L29 [Kiritimatiellae bacterium]|nr:50S ribosomal protein L29 [Kiritimatiellia bacterium]MBR4946338.1 50S ribosomal protein L29 [Kiritimatiellia bacterium]MBR5587293.1 50S ribosomal protein L29 [Kiritimatiellia bacterium]